MFVSFLMMAKNVAPYISRAIIELQKVDAVKWELIIIDDGSDDDTYNIAKMYSINDSRIIVKKNPFIGKVDGTSYAYTLSKGYIIKCIDSDDILLNDWFSYIPKMQHYDAHCHSAIIVDENLKELAKYFPNPDLISSSFEEAAKGLMSLPKWSWSFKRSVAEKIFPLPSNLPFEDVWMAIIIKKCTSDIMVIEKPLYLYRQHQNQTFGGIVNFSREVVIFRAKRLLKLIEIISRDPRVLNDSSLNERSFYIAKKLNSFLSGDKLSIMKVFYSNLPFKYKLRVIGYRCFPGVVSRLIRVKWFFDAYKN